MSGLYSTLQLGQRAVQTQRQGIELAGHNIANVDNPAFARQRIDVSTGPTVVNPNGIQSSGVTTEQISSIRNEILDTSIQQENSLTSYLEKKNEILDQAQAKLGPTFLAQPGGLAGEEVSGLLSHLDGLFGQFQELANAPTSRTHRVALLEQAETLVQDFHRVDRALTEIQAQLDGELANTVEEANDLLSNIAELNHSIEQAENRSGAPANDLRDRRTAKLEALSQLTHFQTTQSENGITSLHLDGQTILQGAEIRGQFQRALDPEGHPQAALVIDDASQPVTQGKLGALADVRTQTLVPLSQRLDTLASTLTAEINNIHSGGFDLNGDTGESFFTGNSAATLAINATLRDNPDRIQASQDGDAAGGNEILRQMAALANQSQANLGERTLGEHMTESIGLFLNERADTTEQLESQTAVQELLERQRNAVSGVSLDEEMTNLVKFQNAFEASARLVSVIDEMLETVVNLGR